MKTLKPLHCLPTLLIRNRHASRWLLLAGWLLMMPPTPMGTKLPPLSKWSQVSASKTEGECETKKEALRKVANHTVRNDPNASALKVAHALGQLQARCVQGGPDEPPPAPAAPAETPTPEAKTPPKKSAK